MKTLQRIFCVILLLASLGFATTSCYQESANVSTACGGLDSGVYVSDGSWNSYLTSVYDGVWGGTSFGSANPSSVAWLYVNYTIPTQAFGLRPNQTWQVEDTCAEVNLTLPSACVVPNAPLQVRTNSTNMAGTPKYSVDWACKNSSGSWVNQRNTCTSTSASTYKNAYEDGVYWLLDTVAPAWANQSSAISPFNGSISRVNITWTDDVNVSTVLFESNYSGTPTNYTMNSLGSGVYNYTFIASAGGNFYWKSWANDTGGNLNVSDTWNFTATSRCYQETANVSTACGGLASGKYTAAGSWDTVERAYDGDWATYANPSTGSTSSLISNYTTPANAVGTVWEAKAYNNSAVVQLNFTISPTSSASACWNVSGRVAVRVYGARSNPTSWIELSCWNGTDWALLYGPTDSYRFYEGGMHWAMPLDSAPTWADNSSSTPATYSPATPSDFNITWTDNNAVSTARFESNYTGTATNYSMNDQGGGVYNYNATLPAGTFYWKSWANDTVNNWASSSTWTFTIAPAASTPTLYINGSDADFADEINFLSFFNCTGADTANYTLYENGTKLNSSIGTAVTYTRSYTADGYFNITCNLSQNYTGAATHFVTSSTHVFNFTVTQVSPADDAVLSGLSASLVYNISTINPVITCTVNVDSADVNTTDITANGTVNVSVVTGSGTHLWYVSCNDTLDTRVTSTWGFSMNYQTFNQVINLSNTSESVLTSPQSLFYDTSGNLVLLYFIDTNPTDELRIHTIANGASTEMFNGSLNATKAFFAVFQEGANTTILTFGTDNATKKFITLNGAMSIASIATSYNAVNNSYYDPLAYANTKHFSSLNQSAASYFLFVLPTTTDSKLIRKNVSSTTLTELATFNHNRKVIWQTILDDQNVTRWLYANLSNSSCTPTTDMIQLWQYNGTAFSLNATPDTNCYSQAAVEGSKVFFERYGNYTYALIANLTGNTTIFQVEGNKTFKFNYTVSNPSKILFIDQETFVFFDSNGPTNLAYTCYFGGAAPACTRYSAFDYGASVPYTQGAMTTATRNGTTDIVATGTVANVGVLQFHYSERDYDTKFICYDEQNEYRQTFTVQVYTNTTGNVLQNESWGYVLPSDILGNGTKRAYALGENGTIRLYVVGLTSFAIDFYSLNSTQGAYYTFTIKDAFGTPVQGAILTAYRFNNAKQAWVVIEQGITDYTGSATFFLEPFTLYQMSVQKSGYVTLTYDFIPSTTTSVTINLAVGGNQTLELPDYDYVWNDTSFSLTPSGYYSRNATNISFTVASSGGKLEYYGMEVTRKYNGTSTVVYSNNITTQPSGGTVEYEVNTSGNYYIDTWFKHEDYDEYRLLTKTFQNGNTSFMAAREKFLETNPIGAWGFYFLAVVVAMLAGGFVSRYTIEGAGLASLAVLWIFTLFNPGAELVCIAGLDGCMTSLHATILTTVAVAAGLYYVWRG